MKSIEYLEQKGIKFKKLHLSEVPRKAQDVERIYGCSLHEVLKAVVFVGDKGPVLALLSGDRKIDIEKLKEVTNQDELKIANLTMFDTGPWTSIQLAATHNDENYANVNSLRNEAQAVLNGIAMSFRYLPAE